MIKKIISIILVLIWMMIIFSASGDAGEKSSGKSDYVATKIIEIFTNIEKDTPKFNKLKDKIVFPIRKCAHFLEYFILSLLMMNMLMNFDIKSKTIWCIIICVLFAISDEVHQLFIEGRSCQITDMLLDSSAAIIQVYLFNKFIRSKYENN